MTSNGFLQKDIISFDTAPNYMNVFFEARGSDATPRVSKMSYRKRAQLRIIAALLQLSLPQTTKAYLQNVGAYELATTFRSVSYSERVRLYKTFEVDDPERAAKFAWWLENEVEAARRHPFFSGIRHTIDLSERDIVVFYGLAGGIKPPPFRKDSTSTRCYKVVCILLDISPLLSPGTTDRIHFYEAKEAIKGFAEASDLFIVPSDVVAGGLKRLLAASKTRCPNISVVNTFLGLSPHGPQSRVPLRVAGKFALTVMTFKRRKNANWLLSAWKTAAAICGDALPHLIIVSSVSDDSRNWLLSDDELLCRRTTIVKHPSDQELRWLFANAAFVIQPPAQGGLGLAAVEALFFNKTVLYERHPANAYLDENEFTRQLDLDIDLWVSAIVEACGAPADDLRHSYEIHARYTRQYADNITDCLGEVSHDVSRQ